MSEIDDGGAAFPFDNQELGTCHRVAQPGLTKRDYFAAAALSSMDAESKKLLHAVAESEGSDLVDYIARSCFEIADAMIAASKSEAYHG